MAKKEIDQKYLAQANQLEAKFFRIVNKGKPDQHRVERAGKSVAKFNLKHGKIWHNHEAELIAEGFMEAPIPPEPVRDLAAEIDELKAKVAQLEMR